MKFHITTFGCQMNMGDSIWLAKALLSRGWQEVEAEKDAEIFILNTCSVRDKPEQKVYAVIENLSPYIKKNKGFIAVGGCVAQQLGEALTDKYPVVRLVFGSDAVAQVPLALEELTSSVSNKKIVIRDFLDTYPEREKIANIASFSESSQAYVNIMQGCDNFCTYCIVPFTRGRQKSRKSESILMECEQLVLQGVREITLLGQNVNSYGLDKSGDNISFSELLHKVAEIEGLERLSFTSSHPKDLPKEVIESFGKIKKLSPFLHLPLQSGSNKILSKMGRKYSREEYLQLVKDLRKACPNIALSTDIIVGFPFEEEEDFQDTLSLMEEVGFESSYSFKYSDRPGVAAVKMSQKVPEDIALERLLRLQKLQDSLTAKALKKCVGTESIVLIEGKSRKTLTGENSWRGRDERGHVVNIAFDSEINMLGLFVPVHIIIAKRHSLVGEQRGNIW